MSGPTKRYTGGNVNFLIEQEYRDALDAEAESKGIYRSDVVREIIKQYFDHEQHECSSPQTVTT